MSSLVFGFFPRLGPRNISPPVANPFVTAKQNMFPNAKKSLSKNDPLDECTVSKKEGKNMNLSITTA